GAADCLRGTKVPALQDRPTIKRRAAAANPAFLCPTNITSEFFHGFRIAEQRRSTLDTNSRLKIGADLNCRQFFADAQPDAHLVSRSVIAQGYFGFRQTLLI